jgi:hypothetical protein
VRRFNRIGSSLTWTLLKAERSPISAQGCFNPGRVLRRKVATLKALANWRLRFANAFSVASHFDEGFPGLKQPWAGIR